MPAACPLQPLRARLTQLRLQLWRTARVILDIKLNCGEMTYEQCCQFLQDNVLFSPQASKGEVGGLFSSDSLVNG